MAYLYGRHWSRKDLLGYVGDIGQLARVRLSEQSDGPARGVRIADMTTGSGFHFTVLIDRGMDIGAASLNGQSLVWHSPAGVTHRSFFTNTAESWLQGFSGGLLVTCGLTNVGPDGMDEYGAYSLHGRASYLPATLHAYGGQWSGDEYYLSVEGSIRETSIFGFDLHLVRRVETSLGSQSLTVSDQIENRGDRPAPLMLLYHCNFGFPLVTEESEIWLKQASVTPRDLVAEAGVSNHLHCQNPTSGFAEQVFFHDLVPNAEGLVTAAIANPKLQMAAYVRYSKTQLPNLTQWKQMSHGTYVVGLEPANCLPLGRAVERQRGALQFLEPGEVRKFRLELGVVGGQTALERLRESIVTG